MSACEFQSGGREYEGHTCFRIVHSLNVVCSSIDKCFLR